jgi:tripartite-type tricarboxylate transporter receptor subunit TctC
LFEKLPLAPLKDFADFQPWIFDFLLCTGTNSPFETLADFVAAAKAKPGLFVKFMEQHPNVANRAPTVT